MSTRGIAAIGTFEADNLRIVAESPDKVVMSGTITAREPMKTVQPFVEKIHAAAIGAGIKELTVDIRSLTFVNSSAIRVLINWVMLVKGESEPRRYRLQFVTSRAVTWQRTSLPTLQSLAPDVVTLSS